MCENHAFEFDVDAAFRDQLVRTLADSPIHPLAGPDAPRLMGVYALYLKNGPVPVYVGQAVGEGGLRGRLRDHQRKVMGRMGIEIGDMTCQYLVLTKKWEIARAEEALITRFDPQWNGIAGFSMHVPGRGRPGMEGYINEWDKKYPLL